MKQSVEAIMANGERRKYVNTELATKAGAVALIFYDGLYNIKPVNGGKIGSFSIKENSYADSSAIKLADVTGEIRNYDIKRLAELTEAESWKDLELKKTRQELQMVEKCLSQEEKNRKEAEKWIEKLEAVLKEIYQINEKGGPGSRKKVRELVLTVMSFEDLEDEDC